MGLEAATYINQLVATNPVGATDPKSQGDDHIKLIKSTLQATFPNIAGEVSATHTQLNNLVTNFTGYAAPSVSVKASGPAAGSAVTALRSDAQLILDQTDDFTWTGSHSFGAPIAIGSALNAALIDLDSTHANGALVTFRRNGLSTGHLGNSGQLGGTVDAFGVRAESQLELLIGGTVRLLINSSGQVVAPQFYTNSQINFDTPASGYFEFVNRHGATPAGYKWYTGAGGTGNLMTLSSAGALSAVSLASTTVGGVIDNGGAVIDVPITVSGLERGKVYDINSGITISGLAAGYTFCVHNSSDAAVTLTQGGGTTLRLAGTTLTGNRTLAPRGLATIWCRSVSEAIISGNVS